MSLVCRSVGSLLTQDVYLLSSPSLKYNKYIAMTTNNKSLPPRRSTTMPVKWDDQTANRFTSLRKSLQNALIDSTLPYSPSNAASNKELITPFTPTRASSSIGAHYGRSHSVGAANSAAKVEVSSLRQKKLCHRCLQTSWQ
eukprot:scaffold710_cov95-Skeletonema_menzelii.AAC.4